MSVKIEILDYKYNQGNLVTWANNSINNWENGTGITSVANNGVLVTSTAGVSLQYSGFFSTPLSLINNNSYTLKYTCISLDNAGEGNSLVYMRGTAASGDPNYRPIGDNIIIVGTNSYTFTMNDSLNNSSGEMELFFELTNGNNADKNIKIKNVSLVNNSILDSIDWDNSIVGELDVTDNSDFPLALTFQISDFKDLTSTSGDYSKTFKVPATKNNNNLLKHLYIPNILNENKVTEQKPCRILFNNLYSLVGLIQVDGLGGYGETPSYYNCVFFGSNLTWASKVQNTYMNQIDWGIEGDNIAYNKPSIEATWSDLDCNSSATPFIYPITSYGDYNELGTQRTIQLLDTANNQGVPSGSTGYYGFNNGHTGYGTPEPRADWRPAIFVKNTLDKIFSNIGYKINSAFMDSDMFKKLVWLLPNFIYNDYDDRTIKYGYGNEFNGQGLINTSIIAPTNDQYDPTDWQIFLTTINLNDAGADFILNTNRDNTGWDAATGIFTAPEYGYYITELNNFGIFAKKLVYNGGSLNVDYVQLLLQVQTVGQTSWVTVASMSTGNFADSGSSPLNNPQYFNSNINHTRYLNQGDKLRIVLKTKALTLSFTGNKITLALFGSSTPISLTASDSANGEYNVNILPLLVTYGQTYNLSDVISPDYTQIDFIKGISHAFNLQMTTDESTRTINIEPFDSFYKPYGDAIDWTYKLDRSGEINDKWIGSDLKRTLVFKYKSDDNDAEVKDRGEKLFHNIQDEYPYREILPDTFKKGESTFENPFYAGTYNAKDQDGVGGVPGDIVDTAYSACLWTENSSPNSLSRPVQGNDFLPRLLYWNKYSPAVGSGVKIAKVQTFTNVEEWITADASANMTYYLSNIYPQATMVNRDNTLYTNAGGSTVGTYSPVLSYGNVWVKDYDDATNTYSDSKVGAGLYHTYYKNMFEGLKRSPRLRTVSISLNITDIVNLDFRKLIYIDGTYWRINKVIDYKPNKNESTKVELIEWFAIGIFAAGAPTFGSSGNSWNPDGSVDDNNDIWG